MIPQVQQYEQIMKRAPARRKRDHMSQAPAGRYASLIAMPEYVDKRYAPVVMIYCIENGKLTLQPQGESLFPRHPAAAILNNE
jgi:hypothetical protein